MKPLPFPLFRIAIAAIPLLMAQCSFLGLGDDRSAGTSTGTENSFGAVPVTENRVTGLIRLGNGAPAARALVTVRGESLVRKNDGAVESMRIAQDTADAVGGFQVFLQGYTGTLSLEIRQPGGGEAYFKKFQARATDSVAGIGGLSKIGGVPGPAEDGVEHFRLAPTGVLAFRLAPKSIQPGEVFWLGIAGTGSFLTAISTAGGVEGTPYRLEGLATGTNVLILARTDTPQGGIQAPDTLGVAEIKPTKETDIGLIEY